MRPSVTLPFFLALLLVLCQGSCFRALVKPTFLQDTAILNNINSNLYEVKKNIDLEYIKYHCTEGEVYLWGFVKNQQDKDKVETQVRSIKNVWSVINYIEITQNFPDKVKMQNDVLLSQTLTQKLKEEDSSSLDSSQGRTSLRVVVIKDQVFVLGRLSISNQKERLLTILQQELPNYTLKEHLRIGTE